MCLSIAGSESKAVDLQHALSILQEDADRQLELGKGALGRALPLQRGPLLGLLLLRLRLRKVDLDRLGRRSGQPIRVRLLGRLAEGLRHVVETKTEALRLRLQP